MWKSTRRQRNLATGSLYRYICLNTDRALERQAFSSNRPTGKKENKQQRGRLPTCSQLYPHKQNSCANEFWSYLSLIVCHIKSALHIEQSSHDMKKNTASPSPMPALLCTLFCCGWRWCSSISKNTKKTFFPQSMCKSKTNQKTTMQWDMFRVLSLSKIFRGFIKKWSFTACAARASNVRSSKLFKHLR